MSVNIRIPAMGEGITDVTITRWLKKPGEKVTKDTPLVEIATDKVDSEIVAPEDGVLEDFFFTEGDVVKVGEVIATLSGSSDKLPTKTSSEKTVNGKNFVETTEKNIAKFKESLSPKIIDLQNHTSAKKFVSPFIRNIALQKGISVHELENIPGSGADGLLTKDDILHFIENKEEPEKKVPVKEFAIDKAPANPNDVEYIELNRMRKAIARNMTYSKHISPHVTSFVEVNLTHIVDWRNKIKKSFQEKYGEKLTFLPFFIHAVSKALKEFPSLNASLDNDRLIIKKNINIGIATALSDGNLIVPVIKNADQLNLSGITKSLNLLIKKARESTLVSEDITGGTFTITNIGTFGNIGGVPIINQPQLAILAVGEIIKKPVAVKTGEDYGIAIQDIAELWLSYDHRIIDGLLGGSFLKRIATILEQFDVSTNI